MNYLHSSLVLEIEGAAPPNGLQQSTIIIVFLINQENWCMALITMEQGLEAARVWSKVVKI